MADGGADLVPFRAAAAPRLRFDEWRDAVSEAFVPLEARVVDGGRFSGHLAAVEGGGIGFASVAGSPVTVTRTPRTIRRTDRGHLKVGVQVRGWCVLTQDGREAALTPGDVCVYDTTRPYELAFDHDFHMMVLMLPRELLAVRYRRLAALTALRISGRTGMGAVLSPFLSLMITRSLAGELTATTEICDAVVDLLAATCRSAVDGAPRGAAPDAARAALLGRVRSYIDERLGDPALDLPGIAAAHHISVRYLQKLFGLEGTTVSAWIRDRRLRRCHGDLSDPRLNHVPVGAIGSRWGYPEPANFARAFRTAYGVPPSAVRAVGGR